MRSADRNAAQVLYPRRAAIVALSGVAVDHQVLALVKMSIVIKRPIRGQCTLDDIERFEEARLHLLGRHADQPNLYGIGPTRQADLQPAFAEVIEHRNLLGKT